MRIISQKMTLWSYTILNISSWLQRFSTGATFVFLSPSRRYIAMTKHFWLSILRMCYWHLVSRGKGSHEAFYHVQDRLLQQRSIWSKVSIVPRLRNRYVMSLLRLEIAPYAYLFPGHRYLFLPLSWNWPNSVSLA